MNQTNEFIKEFGQDLYSKLCYVYSFIKDDIGKVPYQLSNFKFTNIKKNSARLTYQKFDLTIEIELFHNKFQTDITYYHSNKPKSISSFLNTNDETIVKKCICDWNFLSKGCTCGAITPYKPKY